jgi:membrane protein implicated in regulation of membrane protease activity
MHTFTAAFFATVGALLLGLVHVEWAAVGIAILSVALSLYSIHHSNRTDRDLRQIVNGQTKVLEEWPECGPDEV